MTQMRKIPVHAHSGYRAEERPICFWLGGERISIRRILRRWYEQGVETGEGARSCFRVEGEDGRAYTLCYRQKEAAWFLLSSR
jgi:hypothetical protein